MADDTPNSILTAAQRDFLKKSEKERKTDYSRQSRSHHRREIAKRTRQAFHDFALLYEALDSHERHRIFDSGERKEANELRPAIEDTIGFLYWAIQGDVGDSDRVFDRSFPPIFWDLLEAGLRDGERRRQPEPNDIHSIQIEYERPNLDVTRPEMVDLERVAHALAMNKGRKLSDKELRSALAFLASETTHRIEPTVDGTPVNELTDEPRNLHQLAERVQELAEQTDTAAHRRWRDVSEEVDSRDGGRGGRGSVWRDDTSDE